MQTDGDKAVIGRRLKIAREKAGLTQGDVAQSMGVGRSAVGMWERGRSQPNLLQFRTLLTLYGGTGFQILFGTYPVQFTHDEVKQLSRALRIFSPGLQAKIEVLIAVRAEIRDDEAEPKPSFEDST